MESTDDRHDRWARFRFSVVGPLLAAPPGKGELEARLRDLADHEWRHPVTGALVRFGRSTIERWYYTARNEPRDPVRRLRRRVRRDAGGHPGICAQLRPLLHDQHRAHSRWSYQLHAENLATLATERGLGAPPSYATVLRYMKGVGLFRKKGCRRRETAGAERAAERLEKREVRSFEAGHVHGLWHLDFHVCSRKVLTREGAWEQPHLLGVLDDRSRLCCHAQWYLDETAETLVHGLSQAFQKRALPRALMTDNGSAMTAAETERGLETLGIVHECTLPYSPYQNAKQEVFWASVEGRLMAMLENCRDLTLDVLNEATMAWQELGYNRKVHSEIGMTPVERFHAGPDVGRESPSSDELRRAFRMREPRSQRRSDGTVSIMGRRFEIPSHFRHLERVVVSYARWDLGRVDLVDTREGTVVAAIYPLDKAANADGLRRAFDAEGVQDVSAPPTDEVAPLLRKLMQDYAATGLPSAYIPKPEDKP